MPNPKSDKRDNTTFTLKVALRERAVKIAADLCGDLPFVMETHGGVGRVYDALYGVQGLRGVVFEKKQDRVAVLARQRPTWAVYEGDCEKAIAAGAWSSWPVDLLDVDPYGDPWPTVTAFMESERKHAPGCVVVVNDGMRMHARLGTAWKSASLSGAVATFGNKGLYENYLDACRLMMDGAAIKAGYRVDRFAGYHCGRGQTMTHYLAVLVKGQA